ncbi:hypothetical protein [Enterobacter sp.]|uniref:hypothetical protein n=1 Tax=Enterobacter sp. TaxID=42895 RepID=UPI002981E9EB|nr:hypothetical protein [Enterobacter sp.]
MFDAVTMVIYLTGCVAAFFYFTAEVAEEEGKADRADLIIALVCAFFWPALLSYFWLGMLCDAWIRWVNRA